DGVEPDLPADVAPFGQRNALPRGSGVDREDAHPAPFRKSRSGDHASLYFPTVPTNKVGVLTGGGDCPGLNAVIRAVVRRAQAYDLEVLGIRNGWLGLIEGDVEPLTAFSVIGILPKGGTILGTSRVNPLRDEEGRQRLMSNFKRYGLDAL